MEATLSVYAGAVSSFLPTPAKSHYTYNLRDFGRVIKGVLLVPASRCQVADKLFRLWAHETWRAFGDRLVDDRDRDTLFDIVCNASNACLRRPADAYLGDLIPAGDGGAFAAEHMRNLFYGDYMDVDATGGKKVYDEVAGGEGPLVDRMRHYLSEYNAVTDSPLSMVMFKFAVEHVSRVSRVLRQDNGNVLLVGIGGSGRRSAAALATFMADYRMFQVHFFHFLHNYIYIYSSISSPN